MRGLQDDIRRYGLTMAILARVFDRLEKRFGLVVWSVQTRPIVAHFDLPDGHARRFSFKQLTLDDALAASEDPDLDLSPDFVREAFARGDVCAGAYDGDHLVAYAWKTTECVPVAGSLWIRLEKDGCRYGYKSLVLPRYRGDRLGTSVGRVSDHVFVERGITRTVSVITLSNLASLRSSFRDPKRRRIGFAGFIERGNSYRTFRTPGVREYFSLFTLGGQPDTGPSSTSGRE